MENEQQKRHKQIEKIMTLEQMKQIEEWTNLHVENVVYCTSKMGDKIEDPWNISVELSKNLSKGDIRDIDNMVNEIIKNHEKITNRIINNDIKLNSY